MKTDHAISEQPDAVEKRVTAQQPTDRCSHNRAGLENLGPHRSSCSTTERTKQRSADVFCNLAFKLGAFTLGFSEFTTANQLFLLTQVCIKLLTRFTKTVNGQRGMRQPMR